MTAVKEAIGLLVSVGVLVCVVNVPGARCAYRSSNSRYAYSRYSASKYRSYRSSGYSYYSPSSYRYTSRYNRGYYRADIRYSRAYSLRPSRYYYYYYNMYFTFRDGIQSDANRLKCSNWEANVNGTALGVFYCPLPFEPSSHKYCCGQRDAEFCCKFMDVPEHMWSVALGTIAGVAIITAVVVIVYRLCAKSPSRDNKKVMSPSAPTRGQHGSVTTSVKYPNQPSSSVAGRPFFPYSTPASKQVSFVPNVRSQQP